MKLNEFNGSRLRTARNYRGMTIQELESLSGINKKDIQAFEEGKYVPTLENSIKLSGCLKFPREHFYTKDIDSISVDWKHFNPDSKAPRNTEISNREKLIMINRIYNIIKKYIVVPEITIDFSKIDNSKNVEEIAEYIRYETKADDKIIADMTGFMERCGFIISDMNVDKKYITPLTQKHTSKILDEKLYTKYFISLGADKKSAIIRNETLAYELGAIVSSEIGLSYKNFDLDEFAGAFLMSAEKMKAELRNSDDLSEYIRIASECFVPIYMVISRSFSLGLISYRKYMYLMNEVEKRNLLSNSPMNNVRAIQPKVLSESVKLLLKKEIFTAESFIDELKRNNIYLYSSEIESILGLSKGTLKINDGDIIEFTFGKKNNKQKAELNNKKDHINKKYKGKKNNRRKK